MQLPIALQMFTLRNDIKEQGMEKVLTEIADIGYQGIEFARYGDLSVEEVKSVLDDLGLETASNHVALDLMENHLERVIQEQHVLRNTDIVCPSLPPERRNEEGYYHLIKTLNEVGRICYNEGIRLSYHNHNFELEKLSNGKTALETILDETDPQYVNAEFDIYWLTRAGQNPTGWIKRYEDRTPLVHLKDMTTDSEQFFAELGTGGVDVNSVLKQSEDAKFEWLIVEQDQTKRPALQSIKISHDYLTNSGFARSKNTV